MYPGLAQGVCVSHKVHTRCIGQPWESNTSLSASETGDYEWQASGHRALRSKRCAPRQYTKYIPGRPRVEDAGLALGRLPHRSVREGCGMSGDNRVVAYPDEDLKDDIEAAADRQNQSNSAWLVEAAREKIERDTIEHLTDQYRIEQRLLSMVEDAGVTIVDDVGDRLEAAVREAIREELAAVDAGAEDQSDAGDQDDGDDSGTFSWS